VIKRRTLGSAPDGTEETQAQPEGQNEAVKEDIAKQAE
jgi:hypothetical protein